MSLSELQLYYSQFDKSCSYDFLTIAALYHAFVTLHCGLIYDLKPNFVITFFIFYSEAETGFHNKPLKSNQLIHFLLAGQQGERFSECTLYKHSSGTRK